MLKPNKINKPLIMPVAFQEAFFTPAIMAGMLERSLGDNQERGQKFLEILARASSELSDDFVNEGWYFAMLNDQDPDHKFYNFFLYPINENKTYKVNGHRMQGYHDGQFGHDQNYDEYPDVFVDAKIFGLITTLATFDKFYTLDDRHSATIFMDRGQDLNECILETDEDLRKKSGGHIKDLKSMMDFVWFFLRTRYDEFGNPSHPMFEV